MTTNCLALVEAAGVWVCVRAFIGSGASGGEGFSSPSGAGGVLIPGWRRRARPAARAVRGWQDLASGLLLRSNLWRCWVTSGSSGLLPVSGAVAALRRRLARVVVRHATTLVY
uniref:DUF3778 domain-containing protein n=1 Tax=Oryza glumipatula TaxID=40148 RepID=A0A0E0BGY8_9ORYZ